MDSRQRVRPIWTAWMAVIGTALLVGPVVPKSVEDHPPLSTWAARNPWMLAGLILIVISCHYARRRSKP